MIVVVVGASASGKSTIGKRLASQLSWPFHEGDDFHSAENLERMKAGHPLGDTERAPWLAAIARSIADHVARGASAVYACSALKRAYRAALVTPASAPALRFVYLHVPRAVLAERLARRRGHFFPPSLLDSQLADLEPPAPGEPVRILTVDATRPVDALVAEIVSALGPELAGARPRG
jgi:gluconokinase